MKKFLPLLFILSTSCCLQLQNREQQLSILSWNVQNLFNGVTDGSEYPEFIVENGDWNQDFYNLRLQNIAKILQLNNPDIIALQEIENESVIKDIMVILKEYKYYVVTKSQGPIQQGFISKYPITKTTIIDPNVGNTNLREILEATVLVDESEIVVINNHWKSKLGGFSEHLRLQSAKALKKRLSELSGQEVIVLGDFNENFDEYNLVHKSYETGIILDGEGEGITVKGSIPSKSSDLYSVWPDSEFKGSYSYKGNWETIDNFFLNKTLMDSGGFTFDSFYVDNREILFELDGDIKKWYSAFQTGYSDHLPIVLKLNREGIKTTLE